MNEKKSNVRCTPPYYIILCDEGAVSIDVQWGYYYGHPIRHCKSYATPLYEHWVKLDKKGKLDWKHGTWTKECGMSSYGICRWKSYEAAERNLEKVKLNFGKKGQRYHNPHIIKVETSWKEFVKSLTPDTTLCYNYN